MKAYIFITLNLCAMNGADMYIYNKARYLKEQGYQVSVFSGVKGEVCINGLKEYRDLQSGYLRIYPGCFTKKKVERVLSEIIEKAGILPDSEVIVESSNIISSLWGELLAKKLACRHLAFLLTERFKFSDREKAFCRFKLDRGELAGIAYESIGRMFEDSSLSGDDSSRIRAFCTNTIDECEDTISEKLDASADRTFCSIGRIDKPYVLPMARELAKYFITHPEKNYNMVFIGGGRAEKQFSLLCECFGECKNVNLVMTGNMFPIPLQFVNHCDLFVSASGSATATYLRKRPTIRLVPDKPFIVGIPGLTYEHRKESNFAGNYPIEELAVFIDRTLREEAEIQYVNSMDSGTYMEEMQIEFDRQLGFGKTEVGDWFDTFTIRHEKGAYRMFNILGKVMSGDMIERCMERMRILLK